MFVIKNAWKSITRAKGRNILIGVIVFTIAAASCVTLAIRNAASAAEESGMEGVQVTATISVDREKQMEEMKSKASSSGQSIRQMGGMESVDAIDIKDYQELAKQPSVENFYYTQSVSLNAADTNSFAAYSSSSSSSSSSSQNAMPGGGFGGMQDSGDFTITGFSSEDAMTAFTSGEDYIAEGAVWEDFSTGFNSDSVAEAVISQDLASYNNAKVGDIITLVNPHKSTETYKLYVSGIYAYQSSSSEGQGPSLSGAMDPANAIYVNTNTTAAMVEKSETSPASYTQTDSRSGQSMSRTSELTGNITPTFVFSDKDNYEAFVAAAPSVDSVVNSGSKIVTDSYKISSSDVDSYEQSIVPLQNLSKFATTLLLIVLLIGAIILIVLNIFNIRERKYEVGVLTAMGIKKPKVAAQFVCELVIVALFGIAVGAGVGAVASVPVANNLLASQVASTESSQSEQQSNFGRPEGGQGGPGGQGQSQSSNSNSSQGSQPPSGTSGKGMERMAAMTGQAATPVNYVSQVNATVNFTVLAELIGLGLLLVLISSGVAVGFVMRYEPLQILAER
ncbi:MAG: FtsX-like permease family protein [Candidatus Ancillula sp.]|jgi:putative ABC transport system permease protein|nr:FtsX-like permease family protein [Candidatus Ancillula sp.]